MTDFTITTKKATYIVAELREPNSNRTYDIMAVLEDNAPEMKMIDYMYGVSLMSEEEIMDNAQNIVSAYEEKR